MLLSHRRTQWTESCWSQKFACCFTDGNLTKEKLSGALEEYVEFVFWSC